MLSSPATVEKSIQVSSLVAKMSAYCDFYRRNRGTSDYPAGVMEVTSDATEGGKLTLLRAVSKEIDVRIRELLTDEDQWFLTEEMKENGVLPSHIPKLPSTKSVKALIKRGSIRSAEEGQIANLFLGERSALLNATEISSLGEMFDRYSAKMRS